MTSSPDVSRGSIAARNERGADRGAESGQWSPRETLLLRGASAADAVPYQRATDGPPTWGRRSGRRAEQSTVDTPPTPPRPAPPVPGPAPAAGVVRDTGSRRSDASTPAGPRLGDVYAEQLGRLR